MKCYNCQWEGEPFTEQVLRWNGVKAEDFCPRCHCNLTLQHKLANKIKAEGGEGETK